MKKDGTALSAKKRYLEDLLKTGGGYAMAYSTILIKLVAMPMSIMSIEIFRSRPWMLPVSQLHKVWMFPALF